LDEVVLNWFNQWNGHFDILDDALRFAQLYHVKSVPFMLVVWSLWFLPKTAPDRTHIRERLSAALLCAVPIMLVTRIIANYAPFVARPIHTDGLKINLHEGQSTTFLDGWSSMPSDHASLFVGLAVAILCIHRGFGLFLLCWAIFINSLPRIVMGLHWPSDILAGVLIGAVFALILLPPLTRLVKKTAIVPYLEAREAIGYPLLFLVTYEIANMFELIRYLINAILD